MARSAVSPTAPGKSCADEKIEMIADWFSRAAAAIRFQAGESRREVRMGLRARVSRSRTRPSLRRDRLFSAHPDIRAGRGLDDRQLAVAGHARLDRTAAELGDPFLPGRPP